MRRAVPSILAASALALTAACNSLGTDTSSGQTTLTAAFQTIPLAMGNVTTSFVGSADNDSTPWGPPGPRGHGPGDGPRDMGMHHDPSGLGIPFMMGGGLGDAFLGLGFGPRPNDGHGPGFGHRPPWEGDPFASCTYNAASGRVECAPETRDGITITRSAAYFDASGTVQTAFDSLLTGTINTKITVTGTHTRRDGATSVVDDASERTVSGLAQGSALRTVNGTSRGNETTTGSDTAGSFTAVRTAGDTIVNVKIPVSTGGVPSYPTSGTIIRSMAVVVTYAGQSPTSHTRREVILYDGTDTAKLTITHDGTTKSCTLPLPHGRPTCS